MSIPNKKKKEKRKEELDSLKCKVAPLNHMPIGIMLFFIGGYNVTYNK